MRRTNPLLILLVLFLLCISCAKEEEKQEMRPNILWIVCEDISPFIGAYGQENIRTPNLDRLAAEGVRYTHAFTTAGVCAPSRAAIITGMYQTSIGAHNMRTLNGPNALKYSNGLNYSTVVPDYVKCFPEYLRLAGYYCTNNEKQDYQFVAPVTVWDENGPGATWRNRPESKPFFSVFNFAITHESQLFMRQDDSLLVEPEDMVVPPYYPDTRTVRNDIARLFTNIETMDAQVGALLQMLHDDGLDDNTIVFFYSDHGGALPWMKREIIDRGIHIPLIIRFPDGKDAGTVNDRLVSSVDFAPTVLSLAGVGTPPTLQGQAFLGPEQTPPRKYIFAGRDRMDTEYDRVRTVRDKQFAYLHNYMPDKPYYQEIEYRMNIPMMKEFLALLDAGKLAPEQMAWFKSKPAEELYDLEHDPHQLHNLALNPEYKGKLGELRRAFEDWTTDVGDMGAIPEKEMVESWWNGADAPPTTATPVISEVEDGVTISCGTKGASIGYHVVSGDAPADTAMHKVVSWDFRSMFNPNLSQVPVPPVWNVYNGETLNVEAGDTLKAEAMRIGYQPADAWYVGEE